MIDNKKNTLYKSDYSKWVYQKIDTYSLKTIANKLKLSPIIIEVLSKRGIKTEEEILDFINSPLQSLNDPFKFKDMEKATLRIINAVKNNEKICVYGDYDVDGITATALMYLFLREINVDVRYYIPNRLEEGYGLNTCAIKELFADGIKLLITVDCGVSAVSEIKEAMQIGMDVIITDHHEASEPAPAYAVINPTVDSNYPFKALSGVGVAFKFITAIRKKFADMGYFQNDDAPNIKKYLDIVALGTVADIVPLVGENRIFVKHGLNILNSNQNRLGIFELIKVSLAPSGGVKVSHIGYSLAPRLNAVGRMGSSANSLKLLLTEDKDEAVFLAKYLDNENKDRQDTEKAIFQEAIKIIDADIKYANQKSIVIMSEGWHQGVVGIVASRLVDRYFKPTIVLAKDGNIAKGSARSIPAFHLHDSLSELSDMMLSFGGHKYAAGVKIDVSVFNSFQAEFNNIAESRLSDDDMIPEQNIDAILDIEDITFEFAEQLLFLEPYGAGNKEPIFLLEDINIKNYTFVGKDFKHLKGIIVKDNNSIEFIGYSMNKYITILSDKDKYNILFTVQINSFNNSKKLQLSVKDIMRVI